MKNCRLLPISKRIYLLILVSMMVSLIFVTQVNAVSSRIHDITEYGAVGDGVTLNTQAIQKAIDACANKGGGTVYFPAGRYLSGTIYLKDNIRLYPIFPLPLYRLPMQHLPQPPV